MSLDFIRKRPTTWPAGIERGGVHQSVMRAHHVVGKVCELLQAETPHKVILEIIDDLMSAPEPGRDPSEPQDWMETIPDDLHRRLQGEVLQRDNDDRRAGFTEMAAERDYAREERDALGRLVTEAAQAMTAHGCGCFAASDRLCRNCTKRCGEVAGKIMEFAKGATYPAPPS